MFLEGENCEPGGGILLLGLIHCFLQLGWQLTVEVVCFFGTRFFVPISDAGLVLQVIGYDIISTLLVCAVLLVREEVTSWEGCSSFSVFLEGILIPKPPCHAGKAKRAYSWSLGVGYQ